MGDHRAGIKIEFTFHGETYKQEWWINWFPEDCGVDQRVIDWFRECADKGYAKYHAETKRYFEEQHNAEIEAGERAELAKLKAKYGDS